MGVVSIPELVFALFRPEVHEVKKLRPELAASMDSLCISSSVYGACARAGLHIRVPGASETSELAEKFRGYEGLRMAMEQEGFAPQLYGIPVDVQDAPEDWYAHHLDDVAASAPRAPEIEFEELNIDPIFVAQNGGLGSLTLIHAHFNGFKGKPEQGYFLVSADTAKAPHEFPLDLSDEWTVLQGGKDVLPLRDYLAGIMRKAIEVHGDYSGQTPRRLAARLILERATKSQHL